MKLKTFSIGSIVLLGILAQFAPTWAQDPVAGQTGIATPSPDYASLPSGQLQKLIAEAKQVKPESQAQYIEMQRKIRDASQALLKLFKDKTSEAFKAVEFDYISSSVMLLGNEGDQSQKKTFEKFRDYLKAKEKLTINDIQIALLAGQNLEHLEDSSIARDAYLEFATIIEEKKDAAFDEVVPLFKASFRRLDLPGKQVELKGKSVQGNEFDISSLKGKYVLIHVWATWSPPSIKDIEHLQKLYLGFRDNGFEIVGISLDEKEAPILDFIKKSELLWPVLWDGSMPRSHPFVQEHGITTLPTSILLDREGKVVALEANAPSLAVALDKIFNPPVAVPTPEPATKPETKKSADKN